MEGNTKVFSSHITRGQKPLQNDLYELVNVTPATPINVRESRESAFGFTPNTNKYYIPKRKIKTNLKVKTVRDIRKQFESDVYPDLTKELEKQQNFVLKKITSGSSREENTKSIAKSMLKCDKPVSRSTWQMLMNLNPNGHTHAIQYVLWNGRCIRVNGSKGGRNKFLCNYDLDKNKIVPKKVKKIFNKQRGLLRNSLNIKFKPGPLAKKNKLDESYQKFNVGNTKLINLPQPGLDVQPKYGVQLEPSITKLVHSLRDVNGTISEKWAEFSVSVLGDVKNNEVVQSKEDSTVSFELNYKYDQRRLLMRHDIDTSNEIIFSDPECPQLPPNTASEETEEIQTILNRIIDSVEISLMQDDLYTGKDEPRTSSPDNNVPKANTVTKEKNKKRFSELDRLDVTVIRLPEAPKDDFLQLCGNESCSLGCVCASLQCSYNLKQHCGRLDCMFDCKCDFSKYKALDSFDSDCPELIPGLINLDNELSLKLAKEEQKFHQTVVLTGDKSVVLKSERRNWKASKRYGNFYNKMCLKSDNKPRQFMSVVDVKLNLENVEPWCMVHNLYKCFCEGKFTDDVNIEKPKEIDTNETIDLEIATFSKNADVNDKPFVGADVIDLDSLDDENTYTSARIRPYKGRKYYDSYYYSANNKILEMEKNDKTLRKRLMSILGIPDSDEPKAKSKADRTTTDKVNMISRNETNVEIINNSKTIKSTVSQTVSSIPTDTSFDIHDELCLGSITGGIEYSASNNIQDIAPSTSNIDKNNITQDKSILSHASNKTKLIAWLEASYKQYKKRLEQGIIKRSLEPPKHGKVALYPWEFILSRYRERKNLFLISMEKPFRIFMAVDAKNQLFSNCINIDNIRFADLHKYPATVKNLLTNATDIKDNFCILCGLTHCWELIGSVTKIDDTTSDSDRSQIISNKSETQVCNELNTQGKTKTQKKKKRKSGKKRSLSNKQAVSNVEEESLESLPTTPDDSPDCSNDSKQSQEDVANTKKSIPEQGVQLLVKEMDTNLSSDISKWFIMTVENDFTEIQFYKRGFFVKYESIIKAINVARMSEKTVRLSSQKCADPNAGPQFGIYAIPNANEYCVFVGPYDKDEPLGIEIVKILSNIGKVKSTRGVWITVKKVDNIKLIDNPLSYLPVKDIDPCKIVSLDNNPNTENADTNEHDQDTDEPRKELPTSPKINQNKTIKPITIRKANGFYQLAPKGILKPITSTAYSGAKNAFTQSLLQPILVKNMESEKKVNPAIIKIPALVPLKPATSNIQLSMVQETVLQHPKPVAEIAPQIKIVDVYSEKLVTQKPKRSDRPECVLILKPEEINRRLVENRLPMQFHLKNETQEVIDQDIENFLATSSVCVAPNAEIYEISDGDDDDSQTGQNCWKDVWIECKNIEQLGYIRGRKNKDNQLSFEFPGFKYTDFYDDNEAFSKINQVLSRKIYVPKRIEIQWQVVESADDLKGKKELKTEHLGSDFVLTKQGLRHKKLLMASMRRKNSQASSCSNTTLKNLLLSPEELDKAIDIITDLDDQSKNLEDEGDNLMNEMANASKGALNIQQTFAMREEHQTTLRNLSDAMSD